MSNAPNIIYVKIPGYEAMKALTKYKFDNVSINISTGIIFSSKYYYRGFVEICGDVFRYMDNY